MSKTLKHVVRRAAHTLLFTCLASHAATLTGHVSRANGTGVSGAFVAAHTARRHLTYFVQTNTQGDYTLPDLANDTYLIRANATGLLQEKTLTLALHGTRATVANLTLYPTPVRWDTLSVADWRTAFADSPGRQQFEHNCFTCHGYQHEIATNPRDAAGWSAEMHHKRTDMAFWLSRMTDDQADAIQSYLTREQSHFLAPLTENELASLQNLPESKTTPGLVFVEYDVPPAAGSSDTSPWSANPDTHGNVWIPLFGHGNGVMRLRVSDGSFKLFPISHELIAGVHSASPAADGTVWLSEFNLNRIAHLDPATGKVEEFGEHGSPTDNRGSMGIAPDGTVWTSGVPLASFNPVTHSFRPFNGLPKTYGLSIAGNGDVWFTAVLDSSIGMISRKDGQLHQWKLPTKGTPQHIEAANDHEIFLTETAGGNILQFDPTTGHFKAFPLPGVSPSPYALALDRSERVWYSSTNGDTVGCLDPETGHVDEYKLPHAEAFLRELKPDSAGRIWYSSPSNHVVGYFYPPHMAKSNSTRNQ